MHVDAAIRRELKENNAEKFVYEAASCKRCICPKRKTQKKNLMMRSNSKASVHRATIVFN